MAYPYPDQLVQGVALNKITQPFVVSSMAASFDQGVGDYRFNLLGPGDVVARLSLKIDDNLEEVLI